MKKNIDTVPTDFGIHIMNHSSDKIFVLDHDYRLKYFNPVAQKYCFLFGIDQLKLGIKMLPKTDIKFWKKAFDLALAGEILEFKKVYLIEHKKHTDLVNIYPIRNAAGDITEISVQAKNFEVGSFLQKDLLEHENLFQSLFDTSPNGVTIRKFKTQELLSFNLKICELFDCTPEEFQNYNRSHFIFRENTQEISAKMKLLEEDRIENFKVEKQYKRKNGEIFWGEATRSIFKIGDETYQIGILEDISKQKEFEEQLIKNEARIKSIFNSTKDKIFAVDKNYKIIDANPAALKVLAINHLDKPFEEVKNSDFDFSGDNPLRPKFDKAFNGEESNFEGNYIDNEVNRFDLVTISPLKKASGEIIGATVYGKEITELKNIQKALAQSEAQLQDAQRLAKISYWEFDVKTQIFSLAEKSCPLSGFPIDTKAFTLKECFNIMPPDDRESFKTALELACTKGKSFSMHLRKIKPDGSFLYAFGRYEPQFENGIVTKVLGAIQDISNEGEIKNELIKNEAKIRAILNSTNDKIYAIDLNYKLTEFNEPAAKLLPQIFEKEKLEIGIEMLPQSQNTRNTWIKHYDHVLEGKRIIVEKKYIINGIAKIDLVTLSPILNEKSNVIGVTVFGKEITDLQNTKQKYRNLFEEIYDAIVVVNQDGIMIDCNNAAQELLGYSKEELCKLQIKDIVHPDDFENSKKYLQKLITDGYYSNYQGRTITKNGDIKYIQVNSNAIYENGKMVGSRDIVRDISQLKKDEENRNQLFTQLAEVNKELKDFAYIVSHDLKAPLRAIKNISTWLSEDYADKIDDLGRQQLQLLNNRVNRMHLFINGIFEYTKVGRIKETKEIVAMEKIIQNAELMLNLKENVEIKILKKLPEIYCEKIKLEQVFQNLISNAIKYNDKNICTIEIDYEELESHYLIKIKDNGRGIEEKNFERIFQIFQTLQSKDDFESTGIGLSIVKRIVQLHGGEINVKSRLGEYAIFEFTLKKNLLSNN
ncbi:MAG: PAS domain S-box protein [Saprospiraceae bacterium]